MKCANCGTEFEDGILFCPVCGKEVQWVPEYNTLETIIQQREIQEKRRRKGGSMHSGKKDDRNRN